MKTVVMNEMGRLTVPADARRALGLEGSTEFELEVDGNTDAIILRPVVALRREDAWAYTAEHRERLAEAHEDSRKARVREMTEDELRQL
jgi:AbrB family looped-hinge helix DNA binding protein